MRFCDEYRGYRIRYRRRRGWVANIWPPLSLFSMRDIPHATSDEGKEMIEQRARELIDAHIASLKGVRQL